MEIVAVISLITVLVSILILISYRRQIKNICRQLAFLSKHNSNMIVSQNIESKAVTELVNQINTLLEIHKKQGIEYKAKESAIKEIITNLSHDIRTPLTSLDGYFQLLVEAETSADRERYAAVIKGRIKSLKEMLDELFTYTKLQNDSYPLEITPFPLNKLFYDTIFSFYNDFKERNIEPALEVTEEPLNVLCNEAALKRVLQNIIKNGFEHGQNRMRISLEESSGKAVITFQNEYCEDEVPDITRIFDRFYKADKARSTASTGLGLPIAKELVEKMGGEISASLLQGLFQIRIEFKIS